MISADFWDEISCEWGHVDLDIPADSDPETIVRAVDSYVAAPLGGFIPPEEEWHAVASGRVGCLLTIECRTSEGLLGIVVAKLDRT